LTARGRRPRPGPSHSAIVATFLSFVWPGLGQLYLGRPRAAAIYALPLAVVLLWLLIQARDGLDVLAVRLFVPSTAATVVVLAILLALWRLTSMADAFGSARGYVASASSHVLQRGPLWRSPRNLRAFAILAAIVLVVHAFVALSGFALYQAGSVIFVAGEGPQEPAASSDPFVSFEPSDGPQGTPYATPDPDGRINVLLVGADSGLGYTHSLTDTMIVVSVDPTTSHMAMFSFPRDIAEFPLYMGGTFKGKLNSLSTYAAARPEEFPHGGLGTLSRELGYLLGAPIHYYASVNLAGFRELIDAVGGVDIVNERAINDPNYGFPDGKVGFYLPAGPHHLDGRIALAYVRSRNGVGDNDFTRARRQQQVLLALRLRMTDPAILPNLFAMIGAAAKTVQTDYPPEQAADLLALAFELFAELPAAID